MPVMSSMIVVKAAFDADAKVWFVESSDIPGLNLEAASVEELRNLLPDAILDLLEEDDGGGDFDLPIEIIAHASARVRTRAVAA